MFAFKLKASTTQKGDGVETSVVEIETGSGKLRGIRQNGIETFRGIPYAAAPIGSHRFKPPRPMPRWSGVRDALEPGPFCPQTPSRLRFAMGDFVARQDEDCLHATVWTPKADSGRRPVLVWLHGGAYMSGAGAIDWYSGDTLAREGDLVVVGVNYRVGALGFLYRPDWSPGNLGLLDQQAALEWVRDNIAAFGGDPGNVTLWGQSAGAQSITFLLARLQTRGLFRRVILQSPPFGSVPRSPEAGIAMAETFAHALGFDASTATGEKLSQVPLETLFAAQKTVGSQSAKDPQRGGLPSPPFWPVGDGAVAPTPESYAAVMADAARHVDVMVGTTREEMGVFFANDPSVQELKKAPIPASDRERLKARRPAASATQLFSDYCGEQIFLNGSLDWAVNAANAGRRVYLYQFDWPSPDRRLQSCHCLDLPFVFGTRAAFAEAPMLAGAETGEINALSAVMRASWIAFARNCDPNHTQLPKWPRFEAERRSTMHFDNVCAAYGDAAPA
jgi:para-nitrobenzyl esterase